MKRKFLSELERYLAPLSTEERNEILRFYEERFQSGIIYENKSESEIVDELETPKQIAINVLEEYGHDTTNLEKDRQIPQDNSFNWGRLIWVLILDFFIVVALVPALIGIFIGLIAGWGGLIYVIFTPGLHNVAPIINLVFIGIAILGLFLLLWLYDVIISIFIWIIRAHLKIFNHKDPSKILKSMYHLKISTYLKHHSSLKRSKSLITALALLAIFIGGIVGFVRYGGINSAQFNQPLETYETSFDMSDEIAQTENLTINIDIYSSDINFIVSDTEEIVVYVKESEDMPLEIEYNDIDNSLNITSEINRTTFLINLFTQIFQENPELTIEIPNDLNLQEISVKSRNSKLNIQDIEVINDLNIDITNGDINLSNISLDNLLIESTNGRITLVDIEISEIIDVSLTNGSINARRLSATNYYFENVNGDINLRDIDTTEKDGESLEVDLTNGDINLENVYVKEVTLNNVNGDIEFNNNDLTFIFDDVDANTTNGDEDINVPQY